MEKRIWLTTDTHFGHAKMHTFCDRPEGFEWKILKGFSNNIKEDDVLIHLGDFSFSQHEYWVNRFFEHVPCKVWLVRGNHDKRSDFWWLERGFSAVVRSLIIKRFGERILFSHMPQEKCDQFTLNIYGHFHNNDHRHWEVDLMERITEDYHRLLAIEDTDYKPVTLKSIVESLDKSE